MSVRVSWLRFVRDADVSKFQAAGWVLVGGPDRLGPTHGEWSCLMMWTGEGSPGGVA
jgi:hypothetical protein